MTISIFLVEIASIILYNLSKLQRKQYIFVAFQGWSPYSCRSLPPLYTTNSAVTKLQKQFSAPQDLGSYHLLLHIHFQNGESTTPFLFLLLLFPPKNTQQRWDVASVVPSAFRTPQTIKTWPSFQHISICNQWHSDSYIVMFVLERTQKPKNCIFYYHMLSCKEATK
jgi:hypothetical protein